MQNLRSLIMTFCMTFMACIYCLSVYGLLYQGIHNSQDYTLTLLLLLIAMGVVKGTGETNGQDSSKKPTVS